MVFIKKTYKFKNLRAKLLFNFINIKILNIINISLSILIKFYILIIQYKNK